MPRPLHKYLAYVHNTNGGATEAHFLDDWEPIGPMIWKNLTEAGLVRKDEHARIWLTDAGNLALTETTP